jgi:hypothetical protein
MGTRLYALTKDKRVIEKLAKVPAGTYAKLEGIKEKYAAISEYDKVFNIVRRDRHLDLLENFLLFGYGRIQFKAENGFGFEEDPAKVREILVSHFTNQIYDPSYDMFEIMQKIEDIPLIVKTGGVIWH